MPHQTTSVLRITSTHLANILIDLVDLWIKIDFVSFLDLHILWRSDFLKFQSLSRKRIVRDESVVINQPPAEGIINHLPLVIGHLSEQDSIRTLNWIQTGLLRIGQSKSISTRCSRLKP